MEAVQPTDPINVFFDRLNDYFPPPVYVGRFQSLVVSLVVSAIVLLFALRPAFQLRADAEGDPLKELIAVGIIVGCVIATLLVQRTVASLVYNMAMYTVNKQHFANTHWTTEYARAMRRGAL